ncbi:MAG: reactive intermediate/imine deaminase [Gammaproteobacteria bacterium]|nr:reactive intermediate/imine deaminase [Gammaproteobacteria bacterium]
MPREAISSDRLPPPVGPFSAAVRMGGFLFVSGQVALSPATGRLIEGDVSAQTEQVLENLRTVLAAAGKTLADVARVNVYLTDMKHFAQMNAVYARHFTAPYPARTTVAVAALPLGAAVEIDLIAQ